MNRSAIIQSEYLTDRDYQHEILQRVSRSFAFTIPQLPDRLCEVVTNAYLLFRMADTIEDEKALSIYQKHSFFKELIEVVSGQGSPDKFSGRLFPLLTSNTSSSERELILNASRIIGGTLSFTESQHIALIRCLRLMTSGMERFQENNGPEGLKNLSALNNYCYYVAGIVGQLLTEIFCDYSEEISKKKVFLFRLAVSFGQGLQMTNILKDIWEDKARGSCWLPQDIFQKEGFDLKDLDSGHHSKAFGKGIVQLIAITHAHLKNALAYTLLLPKREKGMRKFCLWALGMAVFTLKKIYKNPDFTSSEDVKVSHITLKLIILFTNATLKSDKLLKMLFRLSAGNLPLDTLTLIRLNESKKKFP